MTKLETVKRLDDTAPRLQIVQSVRTLQQSVNEMQQSLSVLPSAIAEQTADALEPLTKLRQDVMRVLEAYDEVTAQQRRTLDELAQEMSVSAAQAFEQRVAKLDATISKLAHSMKMMEQSAQQMASLPRKLIKAQQSMAKSAHQLTHQLTEAAQKVRPRLWKQALGLILAGAVGAMLVATGQAALDRLLPPSDVQQAANWANAILSKATPQERELLKKIADRPAN